MKRAFFISVYFFIFFSYVSADAQNATITLESDSTWIPEYGNVCKIKVRINGNTPNTHITFQLESSSWPGTSMNSGDKTNISDDLKFLHAENTVTQGEKTGPNDGEDNPMLVVTPLGSPIRMII